MGTAYSAGVFFGAFVETASRLGKDLEHYVDSRKAGPKGVEVDRVGNFWTGKTWLVIRAAGSIRVFETGDPVVGPVFLEENPAWRPAIEAFLARLGAEPSPAVGWHFAVTVA